MKDNCKDNPQSHEVSWVKWLTPPAGPAISVFPEKLFNVELPPPFRKRNLNRAGLLLAQLCLSANDVLKPWVDTHPFRVGAYFALDWGPIDFPASTRMADNPAESLAAGFRQFVNPRTYFHILPASAPSQIEAYLGIMGPTAIHTHSLLGGRMAYHHAVRDLSSGLIDAALVGSTFTLENPLLAQRESLRAGKNRRVSECAVALVLSRHAALRPETAPAFLDGKLPGDSSPWYGISAELLAQAKSLARTAP